MRLLLIGFMLLLPLPALAQFVDPIYGNPKFSAENSGTIWRVSSPHYS
jgi:hypothetical protein